MENVQIKQMPLGVKLLSILGYIGAAIFALLGIGLFIGSGFVTLLMPEDIFSQAIISGVIIGLGIFCILLGVLEFFAAKALWNGKNWARIFFAIIYWAGIGTSAYMLSFNRNGASGIVSSIISILISFGVFYYIIFSSEVKQAFSH